MMELIYTSSSKGVDRGSQGYCTVACSDSLPPMLKMNLENMSDYSWIYPPHDKNFKNNPVNYSFVKVKAGDEWLTVLSRIGLNGLDYSGRPNKIAHFVCLDEDDLDECHEFSPAQLMIRENTFVKSWEDGSQFEENDFSELAPDNSGTSAEYWEEITGNSAWAADFVNKYKDSPDSQISVIYDSDMDPLRLIAEATALLTPEEQWETAFSTYFNGTSLNSTCNWRFILRGSKYHTGLKSTKNFIDLRELKNQTPESDLIMDELSMDAPESSTTVSQGTSVSSGPEARRKVRYRKSPAKVQKTSGGKSGIVILLILIIIGLTGILLSKNALFGNKSHGDSAGAVEEENLFAYEVEPVPIPAGHELEEFGDVLVLVKTDDFLNALKINKKMTLDIFPGKPEKIEIKLVSTKQFKVIENVISKLYLEKVDGEFIQNKEALIKLKNSKFLIIESLREIDQSFIDEFKTNIKKMKVNRVIFEFI